jgi:hypothetical protein
MEIINNGSAFTFNIWQGYNKTSLSRRVKFVKLHHDENIVVTLSQQLSWPYITKVIAIRKLRKQLILLEKHAKLQNLTEKI